MGENYLIRYAIENIGNCSVYKRKLLPPWLSLFRQSPLVKLWPYHNPSPAK
jgi:hypothetical protein